MLLAPGDKGGEGWHERLADVGQRIFYSGRNFWIDLAMDEVALLQILQRLREHLLGTVCHQTTHLIKTEDASLADMELIKHYPRPLIAKATYHIAYRTR